MVIQNMDSVAVRKAKNLGRKPDGKHQTRHDAADLFAALYLSQRTPRFALSPLSARRRFDLLDFIK
jgi:hypothetical protein